jgi:hypothetical protein
MGDRDEAQQLMQAVTRLQSEFRVLRKVLDQQEEAVLLRRWGRRWERERRARRLLEARN